MSDINLLWILLSSFLVFLMQFGFSLIETGTVRTKNTINVAMKNLIDTVFCVLFFWLIGFGLMFGTDSNGLFGTNRFLIDGSDLEENAIFLFQSMFAATAITIISGAVAERIKFNGYVIVAILVTAVIYPLFGHWAWNEKGWLNQLGFVDFAGSTVVHSMGAWIGLAGTIVLGPRLGKFKNGQIRYFAPSNHNFIVFGVFMLFFAWFGFNAGSLLRFDIQVTSILMNTLISAVMGGASAWILSLLFKKKLEVEILSFGIIAGLVGITAGCNSLTLYESAFVGFVSTIIMYFSDHFLANKMKIDDPLSAISIHGFAGAWGTIAVGIFATPLDGMSRLDFITIQFIGIVCAFIFAFFTGIILFLILYKLNLLRVKKRHEVLGLNRSEHNARLPWVETIESIISIMKTGNVTKKVYEERDTEVGIVAKFFNLLLENLRDQNTKLSDSNKNLHKKAYFDNLTKVLNRSGLFEKLNKNFSNKNYCLAIIDIDKFKLINDNYGHDIGDSVLKELSTLISSKIRSDDLFARWGGEEFILILKTDELTTAQTISEKIRHEVENYIFNKVNNVTVSVGVSGFKTKEQSFDEVLKNADKALYDAKNSGRNRVHVF